MQILAPTNTFQPKLDERPEGVTAPRYKLTPQIVQILKLINDFKSLQAKHICRFVTQREVDANLKRKLRTLWLDGMVERFMVYSGSISEMCYYYILSKKGADFLRDLGQYEDNRIQPMKIGRNKELSWRTFGHDSWVADLASFEAMMQDEKLQMRFLGELACVEYDRIEGKIQEILSPDYLTLFQHEGEEYHVYNEFERTYKSHQKKVHKLTLYQQFFQEYQLNDPIRFVFVNEKMEFAYWASIMKKEPSLLMGLNIYSTNLERIQSVEDFKNPIYIQVTERNLPLETIGAVRRINRSKYDPVKLFEWL